MNQDRIQSYRNTDLESILQAQANLPVAAYKDQIQQAIAHSIFTVVSGATGSGKTTQVPQYILEQYEFDRSLRIAVTQPRIISAIGAATRISTELVLAQNSEEFELGNRVGFHTGREKSVGNGRFQNITVQTSGLAIAQQFTNGHRRHPNVLIIDEAHDPDLHNVFLLGLVKDFLMRKPEAFKVVIMSATPDTERYREFVRPIQKDIPVIDVPGRLFPIEHRVRPSEDFYAEIVAQANAGKHTLVFVEGKREIQEVIDTLKPVLPRADILPFHAELSPAELAAVLKLKPTQPTIIVATNVGESSITIPYINATVDRGFEKVMRVSDGVPTLATEYASKASLKQRAGRAGRTQPGTSIFIGEEDIERPKFPPSHVQTTPFARHLLISYINRLQPLYRKGVLPAMPNREVYKQSKNELLITNAVRFTDGGEPVIQEFGQFALRLPIDVRPARVIYENLESPFLREISLAAIIMSLKGFLSKLTHWKSLLPKKAYKSDLLAFVDLIKILSSTEPGNDVLRTLEQLRDKRGDLLIDREKLFEFHDTPVADREPLFEAVDLSQIGIKTPKLRDILAAYEKVLERLDEELEFLAAVPESEGEAEKMINSNLADGLCAAYHDMQCIYDKKSARYILHGENRDMKFRAAETSIIKQKPGVHYIGAPFCIVNGFPDDEVRNETAILTFITQVDPEHADHYARSVSATMSGLPNHARTILTMPFSLGSDITIPEIARELARHTIEVGSRDQAALLAWFMWDHNESFKKYALAHTSTELQTVINKLADICLNHLHKFPMRNVIRELQKLSQDTEIFQDFQAARSR